MNFFLKKYSVILGACAVFIIGLLFIGAVASAAPRAYPSGTVISIKKDMTLSQAADLLASDGAIRSAFIYKAYVTLLGGKNSVKIGDYLLKQPESALKLAYRTVNGIEGLPKIKITIPEGSDSSDIAWIILKGIPSFDSAGFIAKAKIGKLEGYLFPDTYFFTPNVKPDDVITAMQTGFEQKVAGISGEIASSSHSLKDIVIMASIIEKEATSTSDRRLIAGILWKRLTAGMALQVDPPFYYILGKKSSELTVDDLAVDSPYNLYKYAGLPPTPIDNPGLDAILDAANPTASKYWYYLSDSKRGMHYAATFDQHVANKQRYIK